MQHGHPLTRLAVVEAALQRWRSCEELAAYLGVSRWTVLRAVRAGIVPHKRRYGAGKHGEVRIRADDFASARERLTADRRPRARRGNRRRLAA
jgi:excisionase family DNA binding protein